MRMVILFSIAIGWVLGSIMGGCSGKETKRHDKVLKVQQRETRCFNRSV